jgi:hypothetical protein
MEDGIIVSTMTKVREKRFISRLKDRDNERRLLTADARNQMLVMKSACMGVRVAPALLVQGAVSK